MAIVTQVKQAISNLNPDEVRQQAELAAEHRLGRAHVRRSVAYREVPVPSRALTGQARPGIADAAPGYRQRADPCA